MPEPNHVNRPSCICVRGHVYLLGDIHVGSVSTIFLSDCWTLLMVWHVLYFPIRLLNSSDGVACLVFSYQIIELFWWCGMSCISFYFRKDISAEMISKAHQKFDDMYIMRFRNYFATFLKRFRCTSDLAINMICLLGAVVMSMAFYKYRTGTRLCSVLNIELCILVVLPIVLICLQIKTTSLCALIINKVWIWKKDIRSINILDT